MSEYDLDAMYRKYSSGPTTLWCDGRVVEENEGGNKKCTREACSKRQEKENEVDDVYQDLGRHGEMYSTPQLRLWAQMVTADLHDNLDSPPTVPAFGNAPKRPHQSESFSDAIGGVAVAIVKALKGDTSIKGCNPSISTPTMSPTKSVELWMKNFEHLLYFCNNY